MRQYEKETTHNFPAGFKVVRSQRRERDPLHEIQASPGTALVPHREEDNRKAKKKYAIYITRAVLFPFFHWGILAYSIAEEIQRFPGPRGLTWCGYLSHWSLVINAFHQMMEALPLRQLFRMSADERQRHLPKWRTFTDYDQKYEPLRNTAFTLSTVVTGLFWALDYHADKNGPWYTNILPHGLPALFYFIDILMNNLAFFYGKFFDRHVGYGPLVGFIYLIFNAIYTASNGTNGTR